MKKRIKIWVLIDSSSNIRELSFSKSLITGLLAGFICLLSLLAYCANDYFLLKKQGFNNDLLLERVAVQKNEILEQRLQIQTFVDEINVLKEMFASLSSFENKVRVIADIEESENGITGIFGIGGLSYETLDSDLPLDQNHDSLIREMHRQTNQIENAVQQKSRDFEELISLLEKKKNLLACTPSISPVKGGWTSSRFGYRTSPFSGRREFHSGLDIANRKGTKVMATASGVVSMAKKRMLLGNVVIIDHGHGMITKYGHLDKILVNKGDTIKRGDIVGLMGNTGRSTGPHVHYEVRMNGIAVNPIKYMLN